MVNSRTCTADGDRMDIETAVRLEFLLKGSNAAGTDQLPTLHLLG